MLSTHSVCASHTDYCRLAGWGIGFINAPNLFYRFELSSTDSGLIASCFDIMGCIAILFVTYIGARGNKPQWIGWGLIAISIGSVLFALPHFVAPHYPSSDIVHTCGNRTDLGCNISTLKNYK